MSPATTSSRAYKYTSKKLQQKIFMSFELLMLSKILSEQREIAGKIVSIILNTSNTMKNFI